MKRYNAYKRRDGRWEGRLPCGKGADGKRKFKYFFGKSREEVFEKMNAIRRIEAKKTHCFLNVTSLFTSWFNGIRHRIKESTAANYRMKAEKHILPLLGSKRIDEITVDDMNAFIQEKLSEGLSNRYVSDIIVLMKSMFKYAVRVHHIINPMDYVCLPKKEKTEIQLLSDTEQKELQEYVANNKSRTSLGIAITMGTGIRIGELCALQGEDIDITKRVLTVRKTLQRIQCSGDVAKTKLIVSAPKSESSKRQIPIPECLIDLLTHFKTGSKEYLLSGTEKPIEPRTMQYRFRKVLNNVNLPSIHFHALRHMFASTCVKLGFDIKSLSEILGHSSVEITLNRYVHSSFEQKQKYMERINLNF